MLQVLGGIVQPYRVEIDLVHEVDKRKETAARQNPHRAR